MWFLYFGVHRGTGVLSCFFSTPPLERDSHFTVASRFPPFYRETPENRVCSADSGLLNDTKGSWFPFLVFFHIKTDGKNKVSFYNDINIQIKRFFSELVESKSYGKHCLMVIQVRTNTALLAFSLGM